MNNDVRKFLNSIAYVLMLLGIIVFAFLVNRNIAIKGLYMDDLYMWSCYGEQSFSEFVFPIGTSTRFRPVYWLFTYVQMALVGTNMNRFVTINIICNIIVAITIFYIMVRITKGRMSGFLASICFLASRFAYYQIGQALGLMETLAMELAILILFFLFRYLNYEKSEFNVEVPEKKIKKSYPTAVILYFLLAFVHERYIVLFPLFYIAFIIRTLQEDKEDRKDYVFSNLKLLSVPVLTLIIIMMIRFFAIGKAIPAGTGGTEVTDTFSLSQSVQFAFSQVLYLLGVNAGPEHLNGITWQDTPSNIQSFVKIGACTLAVLFLIFIVSLIAKLCGKNEDEKESAKEEICVSIMFISFIALCVACSSVTIRVEMRWIYVSFVALMMFTAYAVEAAKTYVENNCTALDLTGVIKGCLVFIYAVFCMLTIYTNLLYRSYFPNIYFWPNQLRMNSLYEETIGKYGTEGVFGKDIYILENSYEMSDFYAETFFKPYDKDKKAEGTVVHFVMSKTDIPKEKLDSGNIIILKEVPENNAYLDITEQ